MWQKPNRDRGLLKRIINNSVDGVALLGFNGNIEYANTRFANLLGYRLREIMGKRLLQFVLEAGVPKTGTLKELLLGNPIFKEIKLRSKRPKQIKFRGIFIPVTNNTKVVSVILIIRDIKGNIEFQQTIDKLNQRLKKYAFITSHDLRSPLCNILGLVRIINYKNFDDPFNKEILRMITEAAHAMDKITRKTHATLHNDGLT